MFADVLSDLNIRSITLLTNNPDKIVKLRDLGVLVEGTEPLVAGYNNFNQRYLNTKRDKMSHIINAPVYIALGTTSADKLKYFKGVAKSRLCYKDIVSIEVESGVSDQPIVYTKFKLVQITEHAWLLSQVAYLIRLVLVWRVV